MNVQVTVIGADRLRAWLLTAPRRFEAALLTATEESMALEAELIRAETPRLTGRLAGSVQYEVDRQGPEGIVGRAGTNVEYAPFVEWGTKEHGAAHHMFQHGAQAATPEVEGRFHNAVHAITSSFGRAG